MMEKYSFWFNDFEAHFRHSLQELNKCQRYCDVTLASDDGYTIQAHKIVLSAGSKFFSNILDQVYHPKPFIYLKGIKKGDLDHILNFIYTGEAFVAQEELNTFLEAAQELKVKGLENKGSEDDNSDENQTVKISLDFDPKCIDEEVDTNNFTDEKTSSNIDALGLTFYADDISKVKIENTNHVVGTKIELDRQIDELIEKNDGLWKCKVCEKTMSKRSLIQMHAETHTAGFSQLCKFCSKTFTTRNSLRTHISKTRCGKVI